MSIMASKGYSSREAGNSAHVSPVGGGGHSTAAIACCVTGVHTGKRLASGAEPGVRPGPVEPNVGASNSIGFTD